MFLILRNLVKGLLKLFADLEMIAMLSIFSKPEIALALTPESMRWHLSHSRQRKIKGNKKQKRLR